MGQGGWENVYACDGERAIVRVVFVCGVFCLRVCVSFVCIESVVFEGRASEC